MTLNSRKKHERGRCFASPPRQNPPFSLGDDDEKRAQTTLARSDNTPFQKEEGLFRGVCFPAPSAPPSRRTSCVAAGDPARTHTYTHTSLNIRHLARWLRGAFGLRTIRCVATEQQLAAQHDWLTAALTDRGVEAGGPGWAGCLSCQAKWRNPQKSPQSRLQTL